MIFKEHCINIVSFVQLRGKYISSGILSHELAIYSIYIYNMDRIK